MTDRKAGTLYVAAVQAGTVEEDGVEEAFEVVCDINERFDLTFYFRPDFKLTFMLQRPHRSMDW